MFNHLRIAVSTSAWFMPAARQRWVQLSLLVLLAGCADNTPAASASQTCDALAARPQAISLTTLLGVGKDPSGTLYAADEGDAKSNGPRVFVSSGSALDRQRVSGEGSNGGGAEADYTLSFGDGSTARRLVIQVRAGKVTGMALATDSGRTFFADLGPDAQPLNVLDASAVAGLTVHNLPGSVFIEYIANTTTGETLLVTRPADDWTYQDFRVFYGADHQLLERAVSSVTRARDGGSTVIMFQVGGADYTAHFPVVSSGMSFMPGPATLATGTATLPLTLQSATASTLSGFTYQCLAH